MLNIYTPELSISFGAVALQTLLIIFRLALAKKIQSQPISQEICNKLMNSDNFPI